MTKKRRRRARPKKKPSTAMVAREAKAPPISVVAPSGVYVRIPNGEIAELVASATAILAPMFAAAEEALREYERRYSRKRR